MDNRRFNTVKHLSLEICTFSSHIFICTKATKTCFRRIRTGTFSFVAVRFNVFNIAFAVAHDIHDEIFLKIYPEQEIFFGPTKRSRISVPKQNRYFAKRFFDNWQIRCSSPEWDIPWKYFNYKDIGDKQRYRKLSEHTGRVVSSCYGSLQFKAFYSQTVG